MVSNRSNSLLIIGIIIVIRMLITYVPIINFHCPEIIKLATVVGLYALLFFNDKSILKNCKSLLPIFIIDIFSFTLLYLYPVEKESLLNSLYALVRPLSWALVGYFIIYHCNSSYARKLIIWFTVIYITTAITTCIGCTLFPNAARLMANGMSEDQGNYALFMNYNIGGFSFVNTLVVFTPLIICLYREKLINRIVAFALLLLILSTILITEYTIALLFYFSCIILFIAPRDFSVRRIIILAAIIIILIWLIRPLFAELLYLFSDIIDSEQIAVRLREIADVMKGVAVGDDSTDLEDRVDLWTISWESFLSNPLFGTGKHGGGHSFVLDNLAKYGLIGLAAEIILFSSIYRKFVCIGKSTKFYGYFMFSLMLQIGLAYVNPIVFYEPFTLVMPLFFLTFVRKI